MASRIGLWSLLLLAALAVAGCEEGEAIDFPVNGGGDGSRDITLEQVTSSPSAGDLIEVRATVTEDGEPLGGVNVTFSARNTLDDSRTCTPATVTTASVGLGLVGTATSQCESQVTDSRITVTATISNPSASDSLNVPLQ